MAPGDAPIDWHDLAASSHYRTAVAVHEAMRHGDLAMADAGIQELIDALSRSEKRALRSHLIRLMSHVIKWQTQPDRRSRSWVATIANARAEIAEIRDETPSLDRDVLESIWEGCFRLARNEAEAEMDRDAEVSALSWEDVFEQDYLLG
ncbi:DUF29 domain-containing protein [Tautonia plasticadhaerens]|uniref:DUF29 domain-containing protein n=1 Tax=Tautonia plasticadhaerens TaxID=2527974 RepID=A0A518HCN2_9BACT|nr:DUF29 domain-containing protein [Tautonia plasticadhaerens]QDV38624.1 hypothetical protein ElP_65790 [Tautonia plasticadhaerens]